MVVPRQKPANNLRYQSSQAGKNVLVMPLLPCLLAGENSRSSAALLVPDSRLGMRTELAEEAAGLGVQALQPGCVLLDSSPECTRVTCLLVVPPNTPDALAQVKLCSVPAFTKRHQAAWPSWCA